MACSNCGKVKSIAKGFGNLALNIAGYPNDAVEELAKTRELICSSCPTLNILITINNINKGICTKCKCVTAAKTRSNDETCPEGKW